MTDYNKKYQQIYEQVSNENKRLSHEQVRVIANQKFGISCYEEGKRNATRIKEVTPYMNSPIWLDYAANLNNICDQLNISFGELCTLSRKRELVMVRQCIMYHLKQRTRYPLTTIGDLFAGRDHSTVIHALEVHENLYGRDIAFTNVSDIVARCIVPIQRDTIFDGAGLA
jgi:hypothetical protein